MTTIQFFKSRKKAPIMLDFVEKAFYQMALLVKFTIIISLLVAVFSRRYHCLSSYFSDFPQKVIRIIGTIGNNPFKFEICNQFISLCNVMSLPSRQKKSQWITQSIYTRMDFRTEPTPTASQGLDCLSSSFFEAPAAHGWARTIVLSSSTFSISGSSAKC